MLDWPLVSAMDWRRRRAAVEAAAREYLSSRLVSEVYGTRILADKIAGRIADKKALNDISRELLKVAPRMAGFATHDGEEFKKFGIEGRRWQWRGQAEAPEGSQEWNDGFSGD